eukprot:scaffold8418_cov106-Isochrysis_galbana.AAC.12
MPSVHHGPVDEHLLGAGNHEGVRVSSRHHRQRVADLRRIYVHQVVQVQHLEVVLDRWAPMPHIRSLHAPPAATRCAWLVGACAAAAGAAAGHIRARVRHRRAARVDIVRLTCLPRHGVESDRLGPRNAATPAAAGVAAQPHLAGYGADGVGLTLARSGGWAVPRGCNDGLRGREPDVDCRVSLVIFLPAHLASDRVEEGHLCVAVREVVEDSDGCVRQGVGGVKGGAYNTMPRLGHAGHCSLSVDGGIVVDDSASPRDVGAAPQHQPAAVREPEDGGRRVNHHIPGAGELKHLAVEAVGAGRDGEARHALTGGVLHCRHELLGRVGGWGLARPGRGYARRDEARRRRRRR